MAFLQHRSAIRRQNIHHIIHRNRPLPCKMIVTGIDIGIPLNLISNVFTNLHYGYDVTSIKVVLLHFLLLQFIATVNNNFLRIIVFC